MTVADRIQRLVRARNAELAFEAMVEVGLGVLFILLVYGFIYFWMYLICGFFTRAFLRFTPWPALATGAFLLVAFWSAWRKVDPLAGKEPLSVGELAALDAGIRLHSVPAVSRLSLPAAGNLLIAGPRNVLDGFATWRHRIRAGRGVIDDAALVLQAAPNGVDVTYLPDARPAVLLHRLALIKTMRARGAEVRITTTAKGDDLLADG